MTWVVLLVLALAPVALMSIYSEQIASGSVRDFIRSDDLSKTANIAMLLQQDIGKTVSLAEAFADAPGTTRLLDEGDVLGINTRLKAITLAFPVLQGAVMTELSSSSSYRYPTDVPTDNRANAFMNTIAESGKPGISTALFDGSGATVIVGAPVGGSGGVRAVVGLEYRAAQIDHWLKNIDLPVGSALFVTDHRGFVVAASGMEQIREGGSYADIPAVQRALNGTLSTSEFTDPLVGKDVVATLVPVSVGRYNWVIIAEKTVESAYKDLQRVRISIGVAGGVLTLLTLIMIVTIARIQHRNARLTKELQEKNIRLNEAASIVQTSNDAIVGFGRDGKIQTWNTAAEVMYGFTATEAVGQSVNIVIPSDRTDEFAKLLANVTDGRTIQSTETVRKRKDGSLLPVAITLSPIRGEQGKVVAISSIDRDISERKKLEQMKDDFISFVSHQLKAPITAMRWTLEAIGDGDYGPVSEKLAEPLEELRGINVQNYHLISDILNASRIDRGVIAVESKNIPLKDIVDRSLRDYRKAIEKAGLSLNVLTEGDALTVKADLEKMAEAVTNSLSNAIKHTKSGGITVRTYREGTFGCIDVTDSGEGMPQEIIDKLFTRSGILGTNTVAEKSAGLGLYIAKHFMELQGGDIRVQSEKGKGTTFTYRIPLTENLK